MANRPDSLTVGAWVAKNIPHEVRLMRFMLPEDHYQTLLSCTSIEEAGHASI